MDFGESFNAAVEPRGRRSSWPPVRFVEAWRSLVDEVAIGYAGDLYEYENELAVRDALEVALKSVDPNAFPEWAELQKEIVEIDDALLELLRGGHEVRPDAVWWRARLPERAGAEFAADAARLFGVQVRVE